MLMTMTVLPTTRVIVFLLFVLFWQDCCLSLNLSPLESAVLKQRLDDIQTKVKAEYQTSKTTTSTFIFPGAGGVDELVMELESKLQQQLEQSCQIIDWKQHRGSILTAAYDGEAVGEAIADLLLEKFDDNPVGNDFHFVGISVGAFCANAAAAKLYRHYNNDVDKKNGDSATTTKQKNPIVKLTLLDPFCGRGVFGPNYGRDNFGKYATSAMQLLNTDDPVPTTNDPLPLCYCVDVTGAPERDSFTPPPGDSMHSWPVAYMARHFQEPENKLITRGMVVKI